MWGNYTENYTKEQQEILKTPGNLLVIAGPGTGKTYTLIGKLKYLLEKNIKPEKILVLTYSVKVSQELKERLKKNGLDQIKVDTFHGLAYDLWRDYFEKPPVIISEKEKNENIKAKISQNNR